MFSIVITREAQADLAEITDRRTQNAIAREVDRLEQN